MLMRQTNLETVCFCTGDRDIELLRRSYSPARTSDAYAEKTSSKGRPESVVDCNWLPVNYSVATHLTALQPAQSKRLFSLAVSVANWSQLFNASVMAFATSPSSVFVTLISTWITAYAFIFFLNFSFVIIYFCSLQLICRPTGRNLYSLYVGRWCLK